MAACASRPPAAASPDEHWAQQRLTLVVGQQEFHPSRAELGWQWQPPGRPQLQDPAALERYVERLRNQIERLPVSGSYAPDGRAIDGLAGEALDTLALRRALERSLLRGDSVLHVDTIVTPAPRLFQRFARSSARGGVVMAAQQTSYRPGGGRATNIELSARALDGVQLLPGAELSFNAVVGQRAAARGFAPALELVRGELIDGIGGGVCQVAGTLHAAAFFAGLGVLEYHAHSRLNRFNYLPPGLDAMVAWPDKDMRLRNPYPFPIAITAAAESGVVRVQLYGAARPFQVDYGFHVRERVAAPEISRPDPVLARGDVRVQQEAFDGLLIARRRTVYTPLRRVEEETLISYPPVPRIVRFGTAARTK